MVVTGLALRSEALILALVPIGVIAGWTPRHPFDLAWNSGLRQLTDAPALPPNPTPRRHAFSPSSLSERRIERLPADEGSVHENPYEFISERAQNASGKYGVKSVSLLAVKVR